jgi:hypothetical protein
MRLLVTNLRAHLEKTFSGYAARLPVQPRIVAGDFIEHAVRESLNLIG